jgi:hypothetical protein
VIRCGLAAVLGRVYSVVVRLNELDVGALGRDVIFYRAGTLVV